MKTQTLLLGGALAVALGASAAAQVPSPTSSYSGQMLIQAEGQAYYANIYAQPYKQRTDMRIEGQAVTTVIDLAKKESLSWGAATQGMAMKLNFADAVKRAGGYIDEAQTSTRIGSDVVAGHSCTVYQQDDVTACTTADGILLRVRSTDGGSMEMQSLERGPQPDIYFQVPAGYRVMDMSSGMGAGALAGGAYGGTVSGTEETQSPDFQNTLANVAEDQTRKQIERQARKQLGNSVGGALGGSVVGGTVGNEAGKLIGGLFGKKKKKKKKEDEQSEDK